MSKNNGYSLCLKKDGLMAMSVSSLAENRWRIESVDLQKEGDDPSPSVQNFSKYSEQVTMMVPGDAVRTSLITLPKMKNKEMSMAASGWVAREEASPVEDWCVSWRHRKSEREEKPDQKDVFLLYASREDIDANLSAAKTWGLEPGRMLPDFMILDSMFRHHHAQGKDLKAWNIVFIGHEEHFLCVSTAASLLLTRTLPADFSEGSDAQEYFERVATEVDRSIFFARQTQYNPDIQKIIVCGDPELARGLVEQLKEETTVPAEFWDVAGCFEKEAGKLESEFLFPAMAAALAAEKDPFNLLPKKARSLLGPMARRRLVLAASTAAVAAVPILVAGGFITTDVQNRYLSRARVQLEQASIRADEAAEVYQAQQILNAREELIVSFSENDTDYAGVLLHLASLTPEQIIYNDLRLKETEAGELVLYLSGRSSAGSVAEAQESFLLFQQALNTSEQLTALGEPRKLVIISQIQKAVEVKMVDFSMEYLVQNLTQPANAVAAIAAAVER